MVDEPVVWAANPVRIDVPAARPNDQADWQQQCHRNPGQAEQDTRRGGEFAPDNEDGHAQSYSIRGLTQGWACLPKLVVG